MCKLLSFAVESGGHGPITPLGHDVLEATHIHPADNATGLDRMLTSLQRVRQLPSVDLLGGHSLAKLLHDEGLANGVRITDVG